MKKGHIILSSALLSLLLGLGIGLNTSIKTSTNIETKAEEVETRNVYLDCTSFSDKFGRNTRIAFSGNIDIPMLNTVKSDVYKYPVPIDTQIVFFYTVWGDEYTRAELSDSVVPLQIPKDKDKRTYRITTYNTGSGTDTDYFKGEWINNYDMPDEEGYYIVNSSNSYKYEGAIKMDEGVSGDKAQTILYHGTEDQYIKVRSYIGNTDTTYPSSGKGYKFSSGKDVNVYISENDEFLVEDYITPPEEDGYYVFGSFNSETIDEYKSEYKTTSFVDESYDYIEVYDNLALGLDDVISIRQHSSSTHPRDKYIAPVSYLSELYFEINGNNVRIKYNYKEIMHYDIFIVQTDDGTYFLPKFHEDKCVNKITAVFFDVNGEKTGTQALPDQISYDYLVPAFPNIDGKYCLKKAYVDEDCTVEYSGEAIDTPTNIYFKYYNSGYYLLPRIVKSEGATTTYKTVYEVGVKMETTDLEEGSLAEITIRPMPEHEGPFDFAFLYYDEDGKISYYQYHTVSDDYARREWFSDYSSVEVLYGNRGKYFRAFIKYDEDSKENCVFLKDAGSGFCNDFISQISNICDSTGANTNIENLQTEWANQYESYSNVEYKREIVKLGFNYFESPKNIFEEMMNKYYYIINKYGSETFENFIFPDMEEIQPNNLISNTFITNSDSTTTIIIISVTLVSISLLTTFIISKKKGKKHHE